MVSVSVTSGYFTGSIAGYVLAASFIEKCYASGTATNSFWDMEASGQTVSAGGTWATGQNAPVQPWSRAKVKHNITLNSNMELIEMIIDTNAVITIMPGDTLTVGGQ